MRELWTRFKRWVRRDVPRRALVEWPAPPVGAGDPRAVAVAKREALR